MSLCFNKKEMIEYLQECDPEKSLPGLVTEAADNAIFCFGMTLRGNLPLHVYGYKDKSGKVTPLPKSERPGGGPNMLTLSPRLE